MTPRPNDRSPFGVAHLPFFNLQISDPGGPFSSREHLQRFMVISPLNHLAKVQNSAKLSILFLLAISLVARWFGG